MDLSKCVVKLDHSVGKPEDLPNWRQIPGFPVFGVGQCTEAGIDLMSEKLDKSKAVIFIMRQEPIVYINGNPCSPRKADNLHENINFGCKPEELQTLEATEVKFATEVEAMIKDGNLDIHSDKDFHENPMEREDIKENVEVASVKSFGALLKDLNDKRAEITTARIPFVEERPLPEDCFDQITSRLSSESPSSCQCVFFSQREREDQLWVPSLPVPSRPPR